MQHRPISVLLVESDAQYIDEVRAGLSKSHAGALEIEDVAELSHALARLSQGGIDAILLSLDLADSHGMVTFDRAYAFAPDVPIIVLTREPDEEAASAAVQGGAQDYLVKVETTPHMLVRAVHVCAAFSAIVRVADTFDFEISTPEEFDAGARVLLKRGYGV